MHFLVKSPIILFHRPEKCGRITIPLKENKTSQPLANQSRRQTVEKQKLIRKSHQRFVVYRTMQKPGPSTPECLLLVSPDLPHMTWQYLGMPPHVPHPLTPSWPLTWQYLGCSPLLPMRMNNRWPFTFTLYLPLSPLHDSKLHYFRSLQGRKINRKYQTTMPVHSLLYTCTALSTGLQLVSDPHLPLHITFKVH